MGVSYRGEIIAHPSRHPDSERYTIVIRHAHGPEIATKEFFTLLRLQAQLVELFQQDSAWVEFSPNFSLIWLYHVPISQEAIAAILNLMEREYASGAQKAARYRNPQDTGLVSWSTRQI